MFLCIWAVTVLDSETRTGASTADVTTDIGGVCLTVGTDALHNVAGAEKTSVNLFCSVGVVRTPEILVAEIDPLLTGA